MNDLVNYKNYSYKIKPDYNIENPRRFCDNLGKMVFSHRRYSFPNEIDLRFSDFCSWSEIGHELSRLGYVHYPVFMYDHSGLAFNLKSYGNWVDIRWDAGQVGYICVSPDDVKREFAVDDIESVKDKLEEILRRELDVYERWCNGRAYRFIIFDDKEEIEYGGGYYYYNDCVQDAKDLIDELARRDELQELEQTEKAWISLYQTIPELT